MFDIPVYWALREGRLDSEDLPERLQALAGLRLGARAAILGELEGALSHEGARVREAAVRALAGATGRPAFRALVAAFNDPSAEVRRAAVETFAVSAVRAPDRWILALLHPRADVRHQALDALPGSQAWMGLHLLADDATAPRVGERLEQGNVRVGPPQVGLLFSLRRAGRLDATTTARLLGQLEPRALQAWCDQGRRRPVDAIARLVEEPRPSATLLGDDALDELFAVALNADAGTPTRLSRRLRDEFAGASAPARHRAAAAVLASGAGTTAAALEVFAVCAPTLLDAPTLDRAERRRAAAALLDMGPRPPTLERERLVTLLQSLPAADDRTLDLGVVAGLLRLGSGSDAVKVLEQALGLDAVVTAFLAAPLRSAPLLSSRCLPPAQRQQLLHRLRNAGTLPFGEIVALTTWALPLDQLDLLEDLTPASAAEVARALQNLEGRPAIDFPERRAERLAARLASRLPASAAAEIGSLLRHWLHHDDPPTLGLSTRLLARTLQALSAAVFVEVCLDLDDAALVKLLTLLPELHELSFGKEMALAHALLECDRAADVAVSLETWARERVLDGSRKTDPPVPPAQVTRISDADAHTISTCADGDLVGLVRHWEGHRTEGLVPALESRTALPTPSVPLCVVLFGAVETPERGAALFQRFGSHDRTFRTNFDAAMVATWASRKDLSWLAACWLWRWERAVFQFGDHVAGKLPSSLERVLTFPARPLRLSGWAAVARLLAVWGARDRNRFWAEVRDGGDLCALALAQLDSEVGDPAADILIALHKRGAPAVHAALPAIRAKLPDVAASTATKLRQLVSTSGLAFRQVGRRHHGREVGEADLAAIRVSRDLDALVAACASTSEDLVNEAVLRLVLLDGGLERLAALLVEPDPVPAAHVLAESVPLWTNDGRALATLERGVRSGELRPDVTFALALALQQRGVAGMLPIAYWAARVAAPEPWFREQDHARLLELDSPRSVALELATAPHPRAYEPAVRALLSGALPLPGGAIRGALRDFLNAGTRRSTELRLEAARYLLQQGDQHGFPLILDDALDHARGADFLRCKDPELLLGATRGVLVAGPALDEEDTLADLLERAPIAARDPSLEQILLDAADTDAAATAVRLLDSRTARRGKLRTLAELFAWGFQTGQLLTGRHHRPHLTSDGAYGYVRRNDPRIYVTPLPLLRGDPHGKDIVQGLILHELGHHRWHGGPDGDRVWEEAQQERLHGLLNLVADEHLERNLRAMQPEWGDKLKRLAAYAFLHAAKEIAVTDLLRILGAHAFPVLVECHLEVAHRSNAVRVDSGALLRALEARGHAFARFMRALRMGLGNRHDDPVVDRALALFKPSFRKLTMPELLEMARELRRIFGDDASLLDGFGGAETVDEGERETTREQGTLKDGDVQPEVERILDPRKLKQGKGSGGGGNGKLSINVTGVPHFDRIRDVQRLTVDPAAHRLVAREVRRPALKLRRFLEELGLKKQPVSGRVQGTRLDRGKLLRLVLFRDPRVLTARQPFFETDLFLGIVVDCSGSMEAADNIVKARRFAVLLAEAARDLPGIDVRIFGFTDSTIYDAGDARRCAAAQLQASGGNNDAAALLHLADVAKRSRRRARVLVMISDGLPTQCSTEALRGLVTRLEQKEHMVVAQVAVRPLEEQCFRHHVRLDQGDVHAVVQRFGQTVARLVRKATG